jgi:hypothetical protein
MKTLRPYTFLVLTALTILSPLGSVWAAPPEAFLSEADADGQVSGNLSNSRAGLMTLQGLTGRNELTYGALPWFGLEGNWGDNYQQQDYYTFEGFVPWNVNPGTDYFFSELGISVTEQGRLAGNWGMGYGYYLSDWDRLLRSFGYGVVDGQYEKTRSGFGFVVENLGKYVDFRGQAFFVTSDSADLVQRSLTGQTHFTGNQFCIDGVGIRETAYHHLDYEIGGPLAYLGDYGISAYGRAYYLFNTQNESDTVGYGVRGEWSITEDVTFNVNYTHDDVFNDASWFTVAVTTPDGAPRNFARPISVRERFSKAVVRDKRIRTNVEVEQFCVPLLNPKTGAPYVFAHVNPNRVDGSGNGTFENPFASIDMMTNNNNSDYNIIYVRPRVDGSATNLTVMEPDGVAEAATPLLLLQNQMLLGSTIDQTVDTLPQPFVPGPTYTIPALDPGLTAPLLMHGDVDPNTIVYASRGNLISGFLFDGTSSDGIAAFHNGIGLDGNSMLDDMIDDGIGQDLHVRNNAFQDMNIGIDAPDLSDGIPSPMCSLLGHSTVWDNTFTGNNQAYDIQIDASNNDGGNGGADTIDGTTLTLSIIGNTIDSNLDGGSVTANGSDQFLAQANGFARVNLIGNEDQNGNGILDPGEDLNGDGVLTQRDLDGDGIPDPVVVGNTVINNTNNGMAFFANNGGRVFAQIGALPDFVQDPLVPVIFNTFLGGGGDQLHFEANSSNLNAVSSYIGGSIIANSFANPDSGGDSLAIIANGQGAPGLSTPSFIDFGSTAQYEGAVDVDGNGIIDNTIDPSTRNAGSGVPGFAGLQSYSGVIRGNLFDRQVSGRTGAEITVTNSAGDVDFIANTFIADSTGNPTAGNGIDASLIGGTSPNLYQNTQLVMSVGTTDVDDANAFIENGDAGVSFMTSGFVGSPTLEGDRSFLSVQNNLFDGTFNVIPDNNVSPLGAGVFVSRAGASLLTAVIGDGIVNNQMNGNLFTNNDVGVQVVGTGSEQSALSNFAASLVYIDDNTFDANDVGLAYRLSADVVLQTGVVTNVFTDSNVDAINIVTTMNSSLGMPVNPINGEDFNNDGFLQPWEDTNFNTTLDDSAPTNLASFLDSNFIQGFGDDGIDITATFESFQNLRISGRQLDTFGNQIRTVIDGQGGGQNGIELSSSADALVQTSPGSNLWTFTGMDVIDVGADAINITTFDGVNTFFIGSPEKTGNPFGGQYVRLLRSGDDGLDVTSDAVTFDNFFINNLFSMANGDDGAEIFQDSLADAAFNITSSVFNDNEGNGLEADIRSIATSIDGQYTAVYNVGTEDTTAFGSAANTDNDGVKGSITVFGFTFLDEDVNNNGILDPGEDLNGNGVLEVGEDVTLTGGATPGIAGNTFSNNNEQGYFFQTLSPVTGGGIAGSILSEDATAPLTSQDIQGNNDNGDFWPGLIVNGETEAFLYANPFTTDYEVITRLNFVGNQVTDNGSRAGNPVDGMVLQIGTNTNQIAWIDANLFGGNELDDFHTAVVVSQDPNDSINNAATNPNRDRIFWDPTARLDIAFGENFVNAGVPPNIDPAAVAPTGPSTVLNPNGLNIGNFGESIFINTVGLSNPLFGRTETGLFSNSDIVKPADRQSVGVFFVYDSTGVGTDLNFGNTFTQSGPVLSSFQAANIPVPATFNTNGDLLRVGFNTVSFLNMVFP